MPRITLDTFNLDNAHRELCIAALHEAGSIVEAAQLLGITRQRLKRMILLHRIEWPRGYTPPPRCDHNSPRKASTGADALVCGDCGVFVGRRWTGRLQ